MLCKWQRRMSTKPSKTDYTSCMAYSTQNCVNAHEKVRCLGFISAVLKSSYFGVSTGLRTVLRCETGELDRI